MPLFTPLVMEADGDVGLLVDAFDIIRSPVCFPDVERTPGSSARERGELIDYLASNRWS